MIYQNPTISLEKFLYEPDGYNLRKLICTTYTLSYSHVFSLAAHVQEPGNPSNSPELIDIAFQGADFFSTAKSRLSIYSNFLPAPSNQSHVVTETYRHLTSLCVKLQQTFRPFHSKLMIACFINSDGEEMFRLQVGSKNFTNSENNAEFALCLEGRPCQDDENANGRELYNFLDTFCSEEDRKIIDSIKYVDFTQIPVSEENLCVIENVVFSYNEKKIQKCILDTIKEDIVKTGAKDIHVFSPFITPNEEGTLFLSQELQEQNIYYCTNLTQKLYSDRDKLSKHNIRCCLPPSDRFLHGKMYFWKMKSDNTFRRYRVWLGSANASENGLKKNSEFMVGFDWIVKNKEHIKKYWHEDTISSASNTENQILCCIKDTGESLQIDKENHFQMLKNIPDDVKPQDDSIDQKRIRMRTVLSAIQVHYKGPNSQNGLPEIKVLLPKSITHLLNLQIEGEKESLHPGTANVIALKQLPCGGILHCVFTDEEMNLPFSLQIKSSSKHPIPLPEPTPLITLLRNLTAKDFIPKCKVKGFSSPNDGLTERVSAYLGSAVSEKEPVKTLSEIIRKRLQIYDTKKDICSHFSAEERNKLKELLQLLGGEQV